MDKDKHKFLEAYAKFYEQFFSSTASSVTLLADLQRDFKEDYETIREFAENPQAIDKLMDVLPSEKQTILLKILLKAGTFGKNLSNLFSTTEKEKRKLAEDLKNFSEEVTREIKKPN